MGGSNGSERGAQFKIVSFHAIVIGFLRGKPKDSWGTLGKVRGITLKNPIILMYNILHQLIGQTSSP